MISRKKAGLLFFLIFLSNSLLAQNLNDFITGVLLDSKSGEPVVFATIRVKNKAIGVISNNDGGFKVPVHFQLEGEALEISCMGYQTKTLVFAELKEKIINRIYLEPSAFELSEAVVTASKRKRLTAKQILKRAIQQIPQNYQKEPFELVGYYRDYQLKNKKYLNLNEALIRVSDQGFETKDYQTLQFGLYDYMRNLEFERDSFAAKPYDYSNRDKIIPDATLQGNYVGNELVLLFIHDAIRNHNIDAYSFVYKFIEDFIKEHRFKRLENTTFGDELVYKIRISKSVMPYEVNGIIYVDVDDYSIRKLDYSVWRLSPPQNPSSEGVLLPRTLLYEILVEYQDVGDKMYLNYISFHNQFQLVRPPKFAIIGAELDSVEKQLKVRLNKPIANWYDLEIKDFDVVHNGRKMQMKSALRNGDSAFILTFALQNKNLQKQFDDLLTDLTENPRPSFVVQVKNMTDAEGNRLGERKSELLEQFREFFAQKVETISGSQPNSAWVDKSKSLNHFNQPVLPKDVSLEGLWMNTPLKSVE
ncbi:carboxypeptidase-like regulatory domain-containing protein [Croceivirga thetidis]|uniref:Carboxypeptidase-like regulatory domain-containing protein n=1 Tax=Croceivirga thetidis TaxID=2721623 RepID=A0ABX1GTU9_9FLAO|nr:carboxypeptidase-like regulatory domain-containing protein [Croceivirga thetidis]NKI33044.1 carboxypeptidase-like regulatory domain-containing protein [Croceivirga thetidis]